MKYNKNQPLYIQVAQDIIHKILIKELSQGDVLDSIRTLAKDYKVTTNTMQNTLKYLEENNIIGKRHGYGTYVKTTSAEIREIYIEIAKEHARKYLTSLLDIGISKDEAIKILSEIEVNKDDQN